MVTLLYVILILVIIGLAATLLRHVAGLAVSVLVIVVCLVAILGVLGLNESFALAMPGLFRLVLESIAAPFRAVGSALRLVS